MRCFEHVVKRDQPLYTDALPKSLSDGLTTRAELPLCRSEGRCSRLELECSPERGLRRLGWKTAPEFPVCNWVIVLERSMNPDNERRPQRNVQSSAGHGWIRSQNAETRGFYFASL